MTLTTEQYKMRAAIEAAFKQQAEQTPADIDSLRACLMMAVQMTHALQLPVVDLQSLASEEFRLWEEYLAVKSRILANRKAGKK